MSYWRLFYHFAWATKDREPLIVPDVEMSLHNLIAAKAQEAGGLVHAVGGVEDHVHLVVSVPPRLALAEFIRQVKGASSHFMNHATPRQSHFAWQAEYGVVSFDGSQLNAIVAYVKRQRQHHDQKTLTPFLEIFEEASS